MAKTAMKLSHKLFVELGVHDREHEEIEQADYKQESGEKQ